MYYYVLAIDLPLASTTYPQGRLSSTIDTLIYRRNGMRGFVSARERVHSHIISFCVEQDGPTDSEAAAKPTVSSTKSTADGYGIYEVGDIVWTCVNSVIYYNTGTWCCG